MKDKIIRIACETKDTLDYKLIKPLQGNYKKRTEKQVEKLCSLIKKRGIRFPSFVAKIDGEVWTIDTHGRLLAYEQLEKDCWAVPPIPVVFIDAKNKAEAKQLLLECDSRYGTVTQSGFDEYTDCFDLSDFLDEYDMSQFYNDLEIPFIDIESVFNNQEMQGDDNAPDLREEAVSVLGEIYELGNSLLMCGDSTDPEVYNRLLDVESADMIFTDPPYGVSYADKNKYACFYETAASYYITAPQGGDLLMMMMKKAEIPMRHCLIWAK